MSIGALKAAILASNPAGYYPLDNLNDLGHDESPRGNHGIQSGTFSQQLKTLFSTDIMLVKGGASPLVSIPDLPEYRGGVLTFECILAAPSDENLVIAERGGDNRNWSLQSVGTSLGTTPPGVQFVLGSMVDPANGRAGKLPPLFHLVVSSTGGVTFIWVNGQSVMGPRGGTGPGVQGTQSSLPIHLFSRGGSYASTAAMAHVAMYGRVLSEAEIFSHFCAIAEITTKALPQGLAWASNETQARAWPGENHWAPLAANPPELAAPISQVPHLTTPPTRAELGYIAGVVTVKQVPAPGRTVRCFDPTMTLVAETVSDAGGHYRFDNLLRNRLYLILAQDNDKFDYSPASADRRKPEAYAA